MRIEGWDSPPFGEGFENQSLGPPLSETGPWEGPIDFPGATPVIESALPQPGAATRPRSEGEGLGRGLPGEVVQGTEGCEAGRGMATPGNQTGSVGLGGVWGGVAALCVSVGGRPVCFGGLAAAGLLGNLSQLLAGAVWACLESGSHQQSETRPHSAQRARRDPGTEGGGQVRVGLWGGHPAHPEGLAQGMGWGLWGWLQGRRLAGVGGSQEDRLLGQCPLDFQPVGT